MGSSVKRLYVFNGFMDLNLRFDDKLFRFPEGKVTALDEHYSTSPDEYRRNHESSPEPTAMLDYTYSPQELVQQLFMSTGENLVGEGCVWVGDREPNGKEQADAKDAGRLRKVRLVEEAQADRNQAIERGGRPRMDNMIVQWMRELGIEDKMYNPAPKSPEPLAELVSLLKAQQQPAGKPQQVGAR